MGTEKGPLSFVACAEVQIGAVATSSFVNPRYIEGAASQMCMASSE
jgi:hypothetical protein